MGIFIVLKSVVNSIIIKTVNNAIINVIIDMSQKIKKPKIITNTLWIFWYGNILEIFSFENTY
ncbi:hypothetical protein HOG21_03980 [bacterium]|nr:hypothetical protein [bacterium]